MKYKKLFIPGPTEVREEVLKAMSHFMIGHRSKEFMELYASIIPKLRKIFYTEQHVFLSTSASTGLWEGAARNCVKQRALCPVMGAFSKKWADVIEANGKEVERIELEWGKAVKPEQIRERLEHGNIDAVALVHNETSTGVMNPLEEIAKVVHEFDDVLLLVDAVSSLTGVKIEVDKLGIDVCFAGVQKAFALPPGLTVFSVSERAMKRAQHMENKGYYFSFPVFKKYHDKNQTPTTPAISQMFALDMQLDRMLEEGLEQRFARHKEMAEYTRRWAKEHFAIFAEAGYESVTLTCVSNTRGIDINKLNEFLAERSMTVANGYGPLKNKTFRVAHMGDLTLKEVKELLGNIEEAMEKGVC
jgi:predicted phosphoserine aminotransferase